MKLPFPIRALFGFVVFLAASVTIGDYYSDSHHPPQYVATQFQKSSQSSETLQVVFAALAKHETERVFEVSVSKQLKNSHENSAHLVYKLQQEEYLSFRLELEHRAIPFSAYRKAPAHSS